MKKNFGQIVLCMLMAVAMGLTACSSDDNEVTTPSDNNENVGYAAYCFDFCGGSDKSKSGGSTDDMTVFTEVEDLRAVVKTVKSLGYVEPSEVYLLGSSQGGFPFPTLTSPGYMRIMTSVKILSVNKNHKV